MGDGKWLVAGGTQIAAPRAIVDPEPIVEVAGGAKVSPDGVAGVSLGGVGVDPDSERQRRGLRRLADKALGMRGVGGVQDLGAVSAHVRGVAIVDRGRGEQADAAMPVRRCCTK